MFILFQRSTVAGTMPDFSCTFVIDNNLGGGSLTYDGCLITDGRWDEYGPVNVAPETVSTFKLKDIAGTSRGAEGMIRYLYDQPNCKQRKITFYMSCPLIGKNEAYMTVNGGTKVDVGAPSSGHPLTATFRLPPSL